MEAIEPLLLLFGSDSPDDRRNASENGDLGDAGTLKLGVCCVMPRGEGSRGVLAPSSVSGKSKRSDDIPDPPEFGEVSRETLSEGGGLNA